MSDRLEGIHLALQDVKAAPEGETVRLDELERRQALWESEMEALVQKAEGAFRAARASEERARAKEKKLAEAVDGDEASAEALAEFYRQLQNGDAAGGEDQGVPAVHGGVESRGGTREALRQLKFGGM